MHRTHSTVAQETGAGTPALPTLRPGVRLLEAGNPSATARQHHAASTTIVQTLVLDHLLLNGGEIQWVDAGGHATTHPLARLAPSKRSLERIAVGRAFTPYQHLRLLEEVAQRVDDDTSLVVCPALDLPYRDDDCSRDADRLLLRALATVAGVARQYDVPVLVTRAGVDEFTEPIAEASDERIEYQETRHGPRFAGEEFETLVYPAGHGLVQTTLAFWRQTIEARRPLYDDAEIGLLARA
ncbi:hypothetical protein [Halomarina oriensis]|uniref:hypothetical protein n=1 Tax=Halomarina oriensis TaxID=671145 RepID=UPI001E3D95B9|nr:hypothetical protein [Halomarina oriensis]